MPTEKNAATKSLVETAFGRLGFRISRINAELEQLTLVEPSQLGPMNGVRAYTPIQEPALKTLMKKGLELFGLKLSRTNTGVEQLNIVEASPFDLQVINEVRAFTMTSPARVWALVNALKYISDNKVEGDVCECGVWRGGSAMAAALKLRSLGDPRRLWLYDTFAGMSEPTQHDKSAETAVPAYDAWKKHQRDTLNEWCLAPLDEVRRNMKSTGYPAELVRYVAGKVEETLSEPSNIPDRIALLRLDTDWYESTRAELEALYDKLVPGGVLIVDDYAYWEGARRAVDEFFASRPRKILLDRIDNGGRIGVKPA
jgi:O-methyltransferase